MALGPELLNALASRGASPLRLRPRVRAERVQVKLNALKVLQQADEEEGHLVVGELLSETDARAGVEGKEYEGVRREVFLETLVNEAVGVEFLSW